MNQTKPDAFSALIQTVIGQAFTAAEYHYQPNPIQEIGGRIRYTKTSNNETTYVIDFQVLQFTENAWAQSNSRFRVELRRLGNDATFKTLSGLVVNDFAVGILPSADHWWQFSDEQSAGYALAEAGHLLFGYGIPWLEGNLPIPKRSSGGEQA